MKIVELIPQVFFDAIARISAGLILLVSITAIWGCEFPKLQKFLGGTFESAPTITSMAILLLAYVLAIGLEGFRAEPKILRDYYSRLKTRKKLLIYPKILKRSVRENVLRRFLARPTRGPSTGRAQGSQWDESWRNFSKVFPCAAEEMPNRPHEAIAIDVLRLLDPAVGSRIVKLRAEVALCHTLSLGWALLSLVLVVQVFVSLTLIETPSDTIRDHLIFILCITLAARMAGNRKRSLNDRHLRALYNHWLLLVDPKAPMTFPSQAATEHN